MAWVATVGAAVPVVAALPGFFGLIGQRPGRVPFEPLHHWLGPVDLSVPLFVLLYSTIAVGLWVLVRVSWRLLRALQAYVLLLVLRMLTLFAFTLESPPDIIDLADPITQLFYPGHVPFRKDLFFSGHTATVALLALAIPSAPWRITMWVSTLLVAMAVVVQHVHWTVDVLAAPVFAALSWWIAGLTVRWSGGTTSLLTAN